MRVLAVCAHPDDESFGLGGLIDALSERDVEVGVLCFTRGGSSTLGGDLADLETIRAAELAGVAGVLGAEDTHLLDFPDGKLSEIPAGALAEEVHRFAMEADALLVFDELGITGHPDHRRATEAALLAAEELGLAVYAWSIPAQVAAQLNREMGTSFAGRTPVEMDLTIEVDRGRQLEAIRRHRSQLNDNRVLWRRLALQGLDEHVRVLRGRGGPSTGERADALEVLRSLLMRPPAEVLPT